MKLLGDLLSVGRNYLLACLWGTNYYLLFAWVLLALVLAARVRCRRWNLRFRSRGNDKLALMQEGINKILSLWKRQFKITRSRSSMDLHVLQVLRCTSFSESFRIFSLFAINVCFLPHQDIHVSIRMKWHFGWYLNRKNRNQNIVIPIQSKFKHSDGQC